MAPASSVLLLEVSVSEKKAKVAPITIRAAVIRVTKERSILGVLNNKNIVFMDRSLPYGLG